MPRYFFHVHDGKDLFDRTGSQLPDLLAARQEAVRYAGALLKDVSDEFWDGDDWRMEVANEDGLTLFVLQFSVIEAPATGRVP